MAWQIANKRPFAQACGAAYASAFPGNAPSFGYWDFSTNAVAPVSPGIPTIGFGPGAPSDAHTPDESCKVSEIIDAFRFYATLLRSI